MAPRLWIHNMLLFGLLLKTAAQQDFTSIDCGASRGHQDQNNISWLPDSAFTSAGKSASLNESIQPSVFQTLRYFPNSTSDSNCYQLSVVSNRRYLLRASFYYGNYDGRSYYPKFRLYINGNNWAFISGNSSAEKERICEVIWTPQQSVLNICLRSKHRADVPFISALESRALPYGSYEENNFGKRPLFTIYRNNLGGESLLRYEDDPHDRLWNAVTELKGFTRINTSRTIETNRFAVDPPVEVLKSAFEGPKDLTGADYELNLSSSEHMFYISLLFWDFRARQENDSCSFDLSVYLGYAVPQKMTLVLDPQRYENRVYWFLFASSKISRILKISLSPTKNSTLPPLLNALEVYAVGSTSFPQQSASSPLPPPSLPPSSSLTQSPSSTSSPSSTPSPSSSTESSQPTLSRENGSAWRHKQSTIMLLSLSLLIFFGL